MDIIAHGLYGGVGFAHKSKKSFWTAVWWGVFPDLVAFGTFFPYFVWTRGFYREEIMRIEPPTLEIIPSYVYAIYNYSHSLIIFSFIFGLVWLWYKKPVLEMLAWPLHIIMDIPTHSGAFFPTPFLYPLSSFYVEGIPWGTPYIFFGYWTMLFILYGIMFLIRYRSLRA